MKKLCMAIALGCAAILALAGCGGKDNRTSYSVDDLKSKYDFQWTDTSKPILNTDGAKDISFTVYSSKNASALEYGAMDIMDTLFEDTNVNVSWKQVSESVYGEQKTLTLGNHKGIDAIYHAGLSSNEITKFGVDRHTLLAIDEYLDYMPTFKAILEKREDIKKQITSTDGHIYALPRVEEMGLLQNPNLLFLNKAWTEAAIDGGVNIGITKDAVKGGLELNADQMEKLLTYFRDHDMNGNGKNNDERPLNFVWQNWQGNQCDLFGMFGLNDNTEHRIIKDGKVTYTVLDDAYRDACNYLNGWLKNKLIDEVSLDISQDNFLANGKSNPVELYGAFYWWESKTVVTDESHYICCKPLKGPQTAYGGKYKDCQTVCVSNNPEISTGELVFFKDSPNIEVLLSYFDRYYLPEISAQINYGPVGIAFEEERENGMLVPKDPPAGKTADELRLQNAPLGICYLTAEQWGKTVQMEERAQVRLDRLKDYATPYYDHNKVKPIPNLQFTKEELATLTRYQTTAENYLRDNVLKWFRYGVSESDWNTHKSKAVTPSVGLKEVTEVYQAAYDRYLGK